MGQFFRTSFCRSLILVIKYFYQIYFPIMKYLDLIYMLDLLYRYYPRYHSSEILLLAEDILKWINNELPHDSSALIYLQSMYDSPATALKSIWKEIQLLAGPFHYTN